MSEGKVPLTTPERIEEIKRIITTCDIWKLDTADQEQIVNDLWAALEEAQKQLSEKTGELEESQQKVKEWQEEAEQWRDDFVEKNRELGEAQQQAAKWEKAFDNADRQYLKQEKLAADLRGELTNFQTLASDNHTLAAKFERELVEAQQTIARQQKALEFYASRMCIQKEDMGWNVGYIAREALRATDKRGDTVMTQIQLTDQQLNRALAELMGYTVYHYDKDVPERCYYMLVDPTGDYSMIERPTEAMAWLDAPWYTGDPAASLEIQEAALKADYKAYILNLGEIVRKGRDTLDEMIMDLLLASPRERAEAAYNTLS